MYAYIKGTVAAIDGGSVVLDNHGIGYLIYVPGTVLDDLSVGDEVKIYTYFSVREDAMQLYGFLSQDDLDLFKLLITVSGIGPKGAVGILSAMSADDLRFAVLSDDAAAISKAPGIGKKTAQKVILELKDKLNLEEALEKQQNHIEKATASKGTGSSAQSDAVMALEALGYSGTESMKAVRSAAEENPDAAVETLIKAALRFL